MTESEARTIAGRVLHETSENPDFIIGDCFERPRSWICCVVSASSEVLVGNNPLVIRKVDGSVFFLSFSAASRELAIEPTIVDRALRRFDRIRHRY